MVLAWLIDHIQRVCGTVVYAGVRLDKDRHFFPPTVKQKTKNVRRKNNTRRTTTIVCIQSYSEC